MNIFKKIIVKLTGWERPSVTEKSGDPRTDILTRGMPHMPTAQEKFNQSEQTETSAARERRAAAMRRMQEQRSQHKDPKEDKKEELIN